MNLLSSLEDAGYISETTAKVLKIYADKWSVSLYDSILQTHILAENSLADAISEIFKLDRLYSFDASDLDKDALSMLSWAEAQKYSCFIPYRDEDGTFQVCMLDPLDEKTQQFLGERLPRFRPLIMDKKMLFKSIDEAYPINLQLPSLMEDRLI